MFKLGNRYLNPFIRQDLSEKMVFIGGPRQVGKTRLSLEFLQNRSEVLNNYFNYDTPDDRKKILSEQLPPHKGVVVYDEIHKYKKWRNLIKGFYDRYRDDFQFIVTGSARLDYYSKGGDSLLGRYHYYRLHPITLNELKANGINLGTEDLLKFGGFPEPLLKGDEVFWRRWQNERIHRVVQDDLRDLENIREISLIELLIELLPERVGSPLSVENLRQDVGAARDSVERWLTMLENLYMIFRIKPYTIKNLRAVKKEKKLYFYDLSQAPIGGARFENLVACQLLKYCNFVEDTQGYKMELCFLRDTSKREIDFVVVKDRRPEFAVECKSGEKSLSSHITYFRTRTNIPSFYQVHLGTKDYGLANNGGRVLPFEKFCTELNMP